MQRWIKVVDEARFCEVEAKKVLVADDIEAMVAARSAVVEPRAAVVDESDDVVEAKLDVVELRTEVVEAKEAIAAFMAAI